MEDLNQTHLNPRETKTLKLINKLGWSSLRNGWPDFTVVLPPNKVVFIEVKSNTDIFSDEQCRMIALLNGCGFPVLVSDGDRIEPVPQNVLDWGNDLLHPEELQRKRQEFGHRIAQHLLEQREHEKRNS